MNEISQPQNLNAHYTNETKIKRPERVVVTGPETIPTRHIYSDREANQKLEALNNDVYIAVQREPKPAKKKFLGLF